MFAYPSGPTAIVIVFKDNHNRVSTVDYIVPTAVWDPATDLLTALATIRDTLVTQLNLNTKTLLLTNHIRITQEEDTLQIPAADCHVNEKASLVVLLDGGENKLATMKIPGPVDGMFQGASGADFDKVDVTDAGLNTFLDQFQATGGSFTLSDGEFLDDAANPARSGRRLFQKTGKPAE